MLVEINLLPQKEPKKIGFIITLSCLVALMLLVGAYYLWQTNATKTNIASLDSQISMTKKIAEKENKSTDTVEATSSVSQLKSAIDWANEFPIQTIPVMRHLTSLLPERGFIQSFAYTEAGTISLTVQFDSAREAAYFLDNLNESNWIDESSLSSLSAAAAPESAADISTASTTSQTNTTAQTTTQANQADSNQSVTDQSSTTDTGNQTTTGKQTSTTETTTSTNTINNSTTASSSTSNNTVSDNILPRYTGQFEIKLNKETVKKNIKKSKKNEEGVTGS